MRKIYSLYLHNTNIMTFYSEKILKEIVNEVYDIINNQCNKVDEASGRLKEFNEPKPDKREYVKTDWHVDGKKKLAEFKQYSDALKAWNRAKADWPDKYKRDIEEKMNKDFIANELPSMKPHIKIFMQNLLRYHSHYDHYQMLSIRGNLKAFVYNFLSDKEDTYQHFAIIENNLYDGE